MLERIHSPLLRGRSESTHRRAMKRLRTTPPSHCFETKLQTYPEQQTNTQDCDVDDWDMPICLVESLIEIENSKDKLS